MKVDVQNIAKNKNHIENNIWSYWCFFLETNIVPQYLLELCKNNPNQPQFLPSEVKLVLKIMAIEQVLYAQVVMIRQKGYDNKNEK